MDELGVWRADSTVSDHLTYLVPLYLSLAWGKGEGGEVSEIRNFRKFYLLYAGMPYLIPLAFIRETFYQVKIETLQNK